MSDEILKNYRLNRAGLIVDSMGKPISREAKNDAAFPLERELNYVVSEIMRPYYRPFSWANVLPVVQVPELYAREELRFLESTGSIVPMPDINPQDDFPIPSIDQSVRTQALVSFINGWSYGDEEMGRAQLFGVSLPNEGAMAQRRAADELLENTAAAGYTHGAITLPGLGNHPDLPAETTLAGGWTAGTITTILNDIHALFASIEVNSKQTHRGDTLILPQAVYNLLYTKRFDNATTDSVLVHLQREMALRLPGRNFKVEVWDKFSTIGAGSTPRIMALDSSDPRVAAMLMARPWGVFATQKTMFGIKVAAKMRFGGVRVLDPSGIAWADDPLT